MFLVENFLEKSLIIVALLSGVPLLVSSLASIVVAVLQTASQIQDQTISHLIRFSVVAGCIYIAADMALQMLIEYIQQALFELGALGRLV
jgi:type III secretory pathway component EscS